MGLKKSQRIRQAKFISFVLSIILAVSVLCIPSDSYAGSRVIVRDGESVSYADKGITEMNGSINLYLTPSEDRGNYFYTFDSAVNTVDVYYEGETDNPAGSYFEGPFTKGSLVTTMADKSGAILADADNGWKIPVPKPGKDHPVVLKIIWENNGVSSLVYTHTFITTQSFSAAFDGSILATIENGSENTLKGAAFAAIYDEKGVLAALERKQFETSGNSISEISFGIDLSRYPADKYTYKVFFWDSSYSPLTGAIQN